MRLLAQHEQASALEQTFPPSSCVWKLLHQCWKGWEREGGAEVEGNTELWQSQKDMEFYQLLFLRLQTSALCFFFSPEDRGHRTSSLILILPCQGVPGSSPFPTTKGFTSSLFLLFNNFIHAYNVF